MKIGIIIHGGREWELKELPKAKELLEKAANIGVDALKNDSSLDAVEKSINFLEDSGYFNCGLGSMIQADGKVRLDAGIMDGSNLKCGAVGAIENIKNPVSVARKIMEKTGHCLIVSSHATEFAKKHGFKEFNIKPKYVYNKGKIEPSDTVGAIAIDAAGKIAVATSTGAVHVGMIAGRVGDAALAGAGFYANEFAGAACTGVGESFIRTGVIRKAVDMVEQGRLLDEVVRISLQVLKEKTGYSGGMVILDKNGNYAAYHTTEAMHWIYKSV